MYVCLSQNLHINVPEWIDLIQPMGWKGWSVGLGYYSDKVGPAFVPIKGVFNGLQTTLQGKVDCLIIVMDDWEQFHANAILLKPTKHCHSLIRALHDHEKANWKSRPGYLQLLYCGVWIIHECSYKVSQ